MLAAARQAVRRAVSESARKFQTSAVARGGLNEPEYVHAKEMYNIMGMKNRKLKFGLGVFGTVFLGSAIPWVACEVQFARAKG